MAKQSEVEIRSARLTTLDREGIVRRAVDAAFTGRTATWALRASMK